jgi:hypothetical protein
MNPPCFANQCAAGNQATHSPTHSSPNPHCPIPLAGLQPDCGHVYQGRQRLPHAPPAAGSGHGHLDRCLLLHCPAIHAQKRLLWLPLCRWPPLNDNDLPSQCCQLAGRGSSSWRLHSDPTAPTTAGHHTQQCLFLCSTVLLTLNPTLSPPQVDRRGWTNAGQHPLSFPRALHALMSPL